MALSVDDQVSLHINHSLYPPEHEMHLLVQDGVLFFQYGVRYVSKYASLFWDGE